MPAFLPGVKSSSVTEGWKDVIAAPVVMSIAARLLSLTMVPGTPGGFDANRREVLRR